MTRHYPKHELDKNCLILFQRIFKNQPMWFRELVRISGLPAKTVRVHLGHLEDEGIIEYVNGKQKRGRKRPFQISLGQWKRYSAYEWSRRVHHLVQDAVELFGRDSVEEQIVKVLDLRKQTVSLSGMLVLDYASRTHVVGSSILHPHNLLVVRWDQINRRQLKGEIQISPCKSIPQISELIKFFESAGKTAQN